MSKTHEQGANGTVVQRRQKIKRPADCQVVLFNDDYTTKDFVVWLLVALFQKKETEAVVLMETVHKQGSAVVGTYAPDIAHSLRNVAVETARKNNFPLRIEVRQA
ncbi:MAG: ATP-dependent Clp protease adaptor ClpS [Treponemataceae bacterium]|nr:ATP-dependent Clp protease adaptor ClpS [Treponemataceae bacterium]